MQKPQPEFKKLDDLVRDHVLTALYMSEGRVADAAQLLGVHRTTLSMRLKLMRHQGYVVPCRCQYGHKIKNCQNHNVSQAPHPEEVATP